MLEHRDLGVLLLISVAFLFFFSSKVSTTTAVNTPRVGRRWKYEPLWWLKLRFFREAGAIISEGYRNSSKSSFQIVRSDADITVLSNKYIDEIRSLPIHVVSPTQANVDNLLGKYSTTDILLESDLHNRVLQTRLTPNLGTLVPLMKDELQFAIAHEFPDCGDNWTPVQIHLICLKLVARVSAKIFVGFPLCRDEQWIDLSIHYTENIFRTITIMRLFPRSLQPLISLFTPYAWKIPKLLRCAQELIMPMIVQRKRAQSSGDPSYQKPNDLLQWMIDAADGDEGQPHKLAHRQLLVTLAAIHTSTMAVTHVLFDLCDRPEYIQPLRDEINQVVKEDGGWQKATPHKMQKLDSFLKESQRFAPPSLLTINRVAMEPLTLSDGLHLPAGTRFSMACASILNDTAVTPDPHIFDGFRYYKQRQTSNQSTHHQFATTDRNNLHFGHGKYSCPGRFFASHEIKMILAEILLRYEIGFPQGQGRPRNMAAFEYIFPDPEGLIMCKRRVESPENVSV